MPSNIPEFHGLNLASIVERLPPAAVHALPFGAVQLDQEGRVTFYSKAEHRLSGYHKDVIARSFFTKIAPCMNNPDFRGRIDKAMKAGELSIIFSYVGDFEVRTESLMFACNPPPMAAAGFS